MIDGYFYDWETHYSSDPAFADGLLGGPGFVSGIKINDRYIEFPGTVVRCHTGSRGFLMRLLVDRTYITDKNGPLFHAYRKDSRGNVAHEILYGKVEIEFDWSKAGEKEEIKNFRSPGATHLA